MSTAAARVRRPGIEDIAPSGRRSTARDQVREQPQLHVVRGVAPARSTMPFLLVVVTILLGALGASMFLNARMADTAYKMKAAQTELNVLNDHVETVRTDVQKVSSPESLTDRATELGMVPAAAPGVVDLNDSTMSGGSAATSE